MSDSDVAIMRAVVREIPAIDWTKSDDLTRYARAIVDGLPPDPRLPLLEKVWDWVSTSHANFPEHDHHCLYDPNGSVRCSCGYLAAEEAMDELNRLDAAADKEQPESKWADGPYGDTP